MLSVPVAADMGKGFEGTSCACSSCACFELQDYGSARGGDGGSTAERRAFGWGRVTSHPFTLRTFGPDAR